MGLVFLPLYVRYLGIESFGLIGVFALLQMWLALLDAGMSPTLGREMARLNAGSRSAEFARDLVRSIEVVGVAIALVICAGLWAASDWLARDWLRAERVPIQVVGQAIGVMAIVVALRFIEGLYRSAVLGLQRQVWYNVMNAALATLRAFGAVLVLAFVSPTIGAFFAWQAAASALSVAVIGIGVYRALPTVGRSATFSWPVLQGVWRFARGMTAITMLSLLLTQLDKVLLSRLLPLDSFGYYTLAATVAGGLFLLIAPVTTALQPHLVGLIATGDEAATAAAYHRAAQLVTILTLPASLLIICFGRGVLFAWSGDAQLASAAGPILGALALGNVLNGLMHVPYQLQLAHGWTSFAVKVNLVAVVLLVPAIFWVVPQYGAIGAAWVWAALNAGYVIVGMPLMHRRLLPDEMWRWYVRDVGMPALGAAVGVAVATPFTPTDMSSRVAWLAFAGFAFFLALLGAVAVIPGIRGPALLRMNEKKRRRHE
jgi:O-antigen/teichoic acid export membrane protein